MTHQIKTRADGDRIWNLLHQYISDGVDADLIIAGSSAYAQQVKRTGERPLPMETWLQQRGWEQHRH